MLSSSLSTRHTLFLLYILLLVDHGRVVAAFIRSTALSRISRRGDRVINRYYDSFSSRVYWKAASNIKEASIE